MTKRSLSKRNRLPAERAAIDQPVPARADPRLDAFAHGPLSEIIDRFRTRLIDEADRIAGGKNVDANDLESAYQRLLASSISADWAVFNRRRIYLIRQESAGRLSAAETAELESLQAEADRHMTAMSPRPLEALWDIERELSNR
jgi:hypothetical protein